MLGAYPGQSYYDPNRPSWLPYWIDDLTESAAKYGTTSIIGQVGGVLGSNLTDLISGSVSNAINQATKDTSTTLTILTAAAIGVGIYLVVRR